MIDLDLAKKHVALQQQARLVADNVFRPISRKYDTAEHAYPKELDFLASLLDGLNESGAGASDLFQDAGALCLPDVPGGRGIARSQIGLDVTHQFAHRSEAAGADDVAGQVGEEALDEVEPGR